MLAPNDTIGKYQIESVLGQGAMGVVYRAKDPDIQRTVALKVLHAHLCQGEKGEELLTRFNREAQAGARCIHPNIVTVFDFGHHQDLSYLVMEYVEGEELGNFLSSNHPFSEAEAVQIVNCVLNGLGAAHDCGVLHRDIKPANIILLDNGGVKIADFGVAHIDNSDLTMVGNLVGTPTYMSPEALRGEKVERSTDIYSVGTMLLEMLTGERMAPQEIYTLPVAEFLERCFNTERGRALPAHIQQAISKAMAADKAARFQNCNEFQQALQLDSPIANNVDPNLTQSIGQRVQQAVKQPSVPLNEMELKALESALTSYVGPIANRLIKQTLTTTGSVDQMISQLASRIKSEEERDKFLAQSQRCLHSHTLGAAADPLNPESLAAKPATQPSKQFELNIDDQNLLTQELAYYLGPMAKIMVNQNKAKAESYNDLCHLLSQQVNDPQERKNFLQKVLRS